MEKIGPFKNGFYHFFANEKYYFDVILFVTSDYYFYDKNSIKISFIKKFEENIFVKDIFWLIDKILMDLKISHKIVDYKVYFLK